MVNQATLSTSWIAAGNSPVARCGAPWRMNSGARPRETYDTPKRATQCPHAVYALQRLTTSELVRTREALQRNVNGTETIGFGQLKRRAS